MEVEIAFKNQIITSVVVNKTFIEFRAFLEEARDTMLERSSDCETRERESEYCIQCSVCRRYIDECKIFQYAQSRTL